MREQRVSTSWTDRLRDADDETLIKELFELADEASRLQRETAEVALRLDQIGSAVAQRWAPVALQKLEDDERNALRLPEVGA